MLLEHRRIECQIADHMVWHLAQHGFDESIYRIDETSEVKPVYDEKGTVVRTYLPEYQLEGSTAPRISIVPYGFLTEWFTRYAKREIFQIDLTVHQRLTGPPTKRKQPKEEQQQQWRDTITSNGDHVTKLSERARMFFEKNAISGAKIEGCEGCECARWLNVEGAPMFEMGQIDDLQIVLCVQRHTWLTIRNVCPCD